MNNLEQELIDQKLKFNRTANFPLMSGYRMEADISPECNKKDSRIYIYLVNTLRWIIELGYIDIAREISMMTPYSAMPRQGHLEQVIHMFPFPKIHHNSRLVLDPYYPDIDPDDFPKQNWLDFLVKIQIQFLIMN